MHADAGIVEQNINRARTIKNCLKSMVYLCFVGDICFQIIGFSAVFFNHFYSFFSARPADDNDFSACFGKSAGNYLTDAAAAASYDGNFAFQSKHFF